MNSTPPSRFASAAIAAALFAICFAARQCPGQEANGFDLTNAAILVAEILSGGPPRDGIPSIDRPTFESVAAATWMRDDDLIVGVSIENDHRAYPLRILVWHEIVNDTVGGQPVAVTYCPLCGTAMTFGRRYGEKTLTFGVSGLLYQSDVLMFDRQTESLWSQLAMKSVSGPQVGTALKWLNSNLMTWKAWKEANPESKVLSRATGIPRDYDQMPYRGYEQNPQTIFPVPSHRTELGNKEWVAGVVVNGKAMAFPIKTLAEKNGGAATFPGGDSEITVSYDATTRKVTALRSDGGELPVVQVYWFAWQAFYPMTALWEG